ncbi:unnamed protein product [Cercopithifilaria johnstoni]|uniref:Succinate dehydrogenase assembly factor 4, mitochondrial n=1 Tax=Cercopithifilaria johnstoni TaxID=2874296 RepID=A0A8J2M094_9BILA|nr:unnamed protein product [Cercopithifilaria johnstoni]
MCSHQAEFTVAKHVVGFMSIVMDGCIFIWVGSRNRLDTLCFAQNFRGMNLIESPKQDYLADSFAVKLNKLFPNKQMLRVFRGRNIVLVFRNQQRFCKVEGVVNEKKIEIEKTPRGKLDHELEMGKENKRYEDPYLPKHPRGINPITGEIGGPAGPEPTRFGDWERKGRCIDF